MYNSEIDSSEVLQHPRVNLLRWTMLDFLSVMGWAHDYRSTETSQGHCCPSAAPMRMST